MPYYSWKEIYHFCFVLLCIWGQFPSTSPRGAYIWRGDLTEGFLRYEFGGLIFGGAYFRNFTVTHHVVFHHLFCNYYTLFVTITFQKLPEHTCHNYFLKFTMSNMYNLYLISNIVHSQLLSISRLHLYKQLWQNNRPWNWDYPKEIRKRINYLKQCTNLLKEISITVI